MDIFITIGYWAGNIIKVSANIIAVLMSLAYIVGIYYITISFAINGIIKTIKELKKLTK